MKIKSTHWADITADQIIREKGDKPVYVCASGITPSGTIHIGNFREIISVELVVRSLRDREKKVRFIYSWDDYDVFRKVPANMPDKQMLETFLRKPITVVPDPYGKEESYARANEKAVEDILPAAGIFPEYIYQSQKYEQAAYAKEIKTALEKKEIIRKLLDEHRKEPLSEDWLPVSVFCSKCRKDTTKVTSWDGEWGISYKCDSCGNIETVDLRKATGVKLPWRIDWPMRWNYEKVDFEPAGKEHHSSGGSFDTAKEIVSKVYDSSPPVTFKYDFITIKGTGGKISSSSGNVISLADVLEVYQPEVVRYMFAGTRPNTEFAISFDLDVLKIYEDYDRCERVYFSAAETEKAKKKKEKQARIYELSQINGVPDKLPYQMQIRHLCNLLQINSGDIEKVINFLGDVEEEQKPGLIKRAQCTWTWVTNHAPEDFRFSLKSGRDEKADLTEAEQKALKRLCREAEINMGKMDEKQFSSIIYDIAAECGLESKELFPAVYKALIGKDKGPRLINFLYTIGKEKVIEILGQY